VGPARSIRGPYRTPEALCPWLGKLVGRRCRTRAGTTPRKPVDERRVHVRLEGQLVGIYPGLSHLIEFHFENSDKANFLELRHDEVQHSPTRIP
jgi:hypothetical protein